MFLSLVRPDRISSPMTRMPAVTIPSPVAVESLEGAAFMKRFLIGDFSRRAAFFFRPRSDAREPRPLAVAVSRRGADTPCWRARAEIVTAAAGGLHGMDFFRRGLCGRRGRSFGHAGVGRKGRRPPPRRPQ